METEVSVASRGRHFSFGRNLFHRVCALPVSFQPDSFGRYVLGQEKRDVRLVKKSALLSLALALLAGCASKPLPAKAPPTSARVPTNALAQTTAPFEGSGWQPLFDGRTLTGW